MCASALLFVHSETTFAATKNIVCRNVDKNSPFYYKLSIDDQQGRATLTLSNETDDSPVATQIVLMNEDRIHLKTPVGPQDPKDMVGIPLNYKRVHLQRSFLVDRLNGSLIEIVSNVDDAGKIVNSEELSDKIRIDLQDIRDRPDSDFKYGKKYELDMLSFWINYHKVYTNHYTCSATQKI